MISCLPIIVLLLNEINVSDRYIVKASRTRRPFGQIAVSAKSRSDYFVLKCELIMVYRNICIERFDSVPELARATEVVIGVGFCLSSPAGQLVPVEQQGAFKVLQFIRNKLCAHSYLKTIVFVLS